MAVPNVSYKVEIAWTSSWLTPAASRTWTDVSAYVEFDKGMTVSYGRSDEVSTADANTLTLTLDNKDGRFTWGNASSPYYPNVKIGKPIRLTATVGGVDYVRFVGYINEWPVEWPGDSAGFALTTITASSRLSRLGLSAPLVSALAKTLETVNPPYYWSLADGSTATAAAEADNPGQTLRITARPNKVIFGVPDEGEDGLGVDGGLALKLLNNNTGAVGQGGELAVTLPANSFGPGVPGAATIGVFFKNLQPGAAYTGTPDLLTFYDVAKGADFSSAGVTGLSMSLDNFAIGSAWTGSGGFGITVAPGIALESNASLHHAAIVVSCDGTTTTLNGYLDGVLVASSSTAAFNLVLNRLRLTSTRHDFVVGRLTVWPSAATGTDVAKLAGAGVTGFAGDTTDTRLLRYAGWAGIPTAEVTTTASPVVLAGIRAEGAKVEALMRGVETSEAGVLYDDRPGNLVLKPRSARYLLAPTLTVAFTSDMVGEYAPKVDRSGLANLGTGTGPDGSQATYANATSRTDYGDAEYTVDTQSSNPDEPLQLVAWHVSGNAEPRPRVPAPKFSVIDFIGGAIVSLLALDIGHKLRLTNAPIQSPNATTADYFVEGYTEEMRPGAWDLSPNLSPVALEDSVWVLDDTVRGCLDTGNVLAL